MTNYNTKGYIVPLFASTMYVTGDVIYYNLHYRSNVWGYLVFFSLF